jgi:GDPmannose 4,6-dehydratase
MSRRALITGITGQDGSHLAEYLLGLGYEVHGIVRRVAFENPERRFARIHHLLDRLQLHAGSLESYASLFRVASRYEFDECYHLAAQSFVAEPFDEGIPTLDANINGTYYMLSALREAQPQCRLYFAGTSEMFGSPRVTPQSETTPFSPRSPYGISKVTGHYLAVSYREQLGMFCCTGILFNHEGPRRAYEFVTRKITTTVARIKLGLAHELRLGNLDARRDWGHAADYVRAMHLMLQQPMPDDYVLATGQTHSVRQFCELAFAEVGLDYRDYVVVDPRFYRPAEPVQLVGDASKAMAVLGWAPQYTFHELVTEMVRHDLHMLTEPSSAAGGKPSIAVV